MRDYILIIIGEKGKEYFECRNLKEVETRIFEYSKKLINFEVYKTIDINEVVELTNLSFKRLINNLK